MNCNLDNNYNFIFISTLNCLCLNFGHEQFQLNAINKLCYYLDLLLLFSKLIVRYLQLGKNTMDGNYYIFQKGKITSGRNRTNGAIRSEISCNVEIRSFKLLSNSYLTNEIDGRLCARYVCVRLSLQSDSSTFDEIAENV